MLAAIDADYFCYAMGALREDDAPMKWPFVKSTIDGKISQIIRNTGATDHVLYLSGPNNFRDDIWTIQRYKGNRVDNEKPHHYHRIKEYLSSDLNWRVEVSDGYEADDLVSIAMYADPEGIIGCHIDKDIDMVPGMHYNFNHEVSYVVEELEGLRWFYTQLLMGDSVDHIPGLRGVGKIKAKNTLVDCTTEEEMYWAVQHEYMRFFGNWWPVFLTENARLLWMMKTEDDVWEIPYAREVEVI